MTLDDLLSKYPDLLDYMKYMPEELKSRYWIHVYPKGAIIHQKDEVLEYFGIVCDGSHRVINEFENGNIYMIERNDPIDFVGEVTILAGKEKTSVTIETLTECTVLYFSRKDFEDWIARDIHFLRLVSRKVAYKLYRSSYNRGSKLFYPPQYLLLDYCVKYLDSARQSFGIIPKTRQQLYEEIGISVKTLNRTIQKLKTENLIGITKGKISIDEEQLKEARKYLEEKRHMNK
ncbi:Crp/Fnr family transcriptional regulator [Sellimonas sp.]|uniref:Crp/Fnr family transcriptional regulator n=1 Tax=Sellimonas sp. TaxID=2021466 RepID=UPI00257956E1|nr:Crp/Fnr family transcriptional regulator [Sellimonas sp.]